MTEQLIKTFIIFFVVIEPVSLVPMFGALTRGGEPGYRRRMALKSVAISAGIFIVFAVAGDWLLRLLGISVSAFKIAGGMLLFLLSVDMVLARESGLRSTTVREQEEARYRDDISVFPMAFPLITGPGALATLLLLTAETTGYLEFGLVLAMGLLALLVTLVFLLLTQPLMRVMGVTGGTVISRLLGVVLSALAVQYVVDGFTEVLV
ncbi:MarC family protein [Wenzhouxiangella sp. XN24]|uniref:MarC family protein n=1 Tax=Wenzhouxiangella sp. XN24 TaxID=2713569 RepID=UPI0013EC19F7|nr:MarC family protein [Wenzhouxiangella sp. XN24]NGX17596.1 NAAT family transporter [Wenzhouxiangella sp. XN24]